MRLAGRVQHVHLSMMALVTICAMCGSPKPALPAVTFESSRGGETREPDLKRVKKSEGTKEGDSKPKSEENHSISDFDGFQLYHYNGLTGLVKGSSAVWCNQMHGVQTRRYCWFMAAPQAGV